MQRLQDTAGLNAGFALRSVVREALERVGGLSGVSVEETLASPEPWGYRNHARFTVRFGGQLGFSNRITRRFVRID